MEELKKQAQTPKETAQELSELAEKLAEMDRAEGAFGESMADALTDEYLEEVVGGLAALAVTTPGREAYPRECAKCGDLFFSPDLTRTLCDVCLNFSDRS